MKAIRAFLANKTSTSIKNFLIPILIVLLYLCLFLRPKLRDIFHLLPEVGQLQAKIITTKQDWANINSFKEKIARLSKEISYYEKKLPSGKEVPAVLEYLSDAAKKLNVKITEIKPIEQSQEKPQIYYSVPILLKAECGYHQLGRFINALERADRFMKISDIKIESESLEDILSVQLIIINYVMGQG